MDYVESGGTFRHPDFPHRRAIFVGDFLDRGPKIRETLRMARSMLEAGTALSVLGNHEWNALAFHLEDPGAPGEFLRRHSGKNIQQHARTLADVPAAELASHLQFFRSLPFYLDLGLLRVVHACWDEVAFGVIDEAMQRHGCEAGLTDAFLVEGSDESSPLFAAVEVALKGKEMELPEGASFEDKDGHTRSQARVRWFESPEGHTTATYTLPAYSGIHPAPLPARVLAEARPYPAEAPPVFFGHYWLDDLEPSPLAANVVCLDFSVAKGGVLCGYRWQSGVVVEGDCFVTAGPAEVHAQ